MIQCTGYLKSWSLSGVAGATNPVSSHDEDEDSVPGNEGRETPQPGKTGHNAWQQDLSKVLDSNPASSVMDCLVAVGRLQSNLDTTIEDAVNRELDVVPGVEFSARHSIDGMFAFIDPRITPIIGYLPQELIGKLTLP